jgi:hypothetical protein
MTWKNAMTILIPVLTHVINTPLFYVIMMEYVDSELLSSNEIDGIPYSRNGYYSVTGPITLSI